MRHMYTVDVTFDVTDMDPTLIIMLFFDTYNKPYLIEGLEYTENDLQWKHLPFSKRNALEMSKAVYRLVKDSKQCGVGTTPAVEYSTKDGTTCVYTFYAVVENFIGRDGRIHSTLRVVWCINRARGYVRKDHLQCTGWAISPDYHGIGDHATTLQLTHCYQTNYTATEIDKFNQLMKRHHGPQITPCLDFVGYKVFSFEPFYPSDKWSRAQYDPRKYYDRECTHPVLTGFKYVHDGRTITTHVHRLNNMPYVAVAFSGKYDPRVLQEVYHEEPMYTVKELV